MNSSRIKLLAVTVPEQLSSPLLGSLKPYFEVQLAGSLDMGVFLLKEWEPEFVIVDYCDGLKDFAQQTSDYFENAEKNLILMCSSLPLNVEKFHRWNVTSFLDPTDSPEKIVFHLRSLQQKLSRLRSKQGQEKSSLKGELPYREFMGLRIYENDFLVKRGQKVLTTTPTQFKLLMAFTSHQDQLLSRQWIRETVWENSEISPRSIDAQISKLKKVIPELEDCLLNIYGKGYVLAEKQKNVA